MLWFLSAGVLIAALILLRRLLRGRVDPRLTYALWLLAALRILIPGTLSSAPVSVAALAERAGVEETVAQLRQAVTPKQVLTSSLPGDSGATMEEFAGSWGDAGLYVYEVRPYTEEELAEIREEDPAFYRDSGSQPLRMTVELLIGDLSFWRCVYLAGAGAVCAALLLANGRFARRLRRQRRPYEGALPVPCPIPVYVAEELPSPCLCGLLRPAVYLNRAALDSGRLDHILTHELTHYRHADHWWALLRCACLAVQWCNPLVWAAAWLSRQDCELACDAGAIQRLGEEQRLSYGRTLVDMIAARTPAALLQTATTMSGGKRSLKERITLIARKPKMTAGALAAALLAAALATGCAFFGPAEERTAEGEALTPENTLYIRSVQHSEAENGAGLLDCTVGYPGGLGDTGRYRNVLVDAACLEDGMFPELREAYDRWADIVILGEISENRVRELLELEPQADAAQETAAGGSEGVDMSAFPSVGKKVSHDWRGAVVTDIKVEKAGDPEEVKSTLEHVFAYDYLALATGVPAGAAAEIRSLYDGIVGAREAPDFYAEVGGIRVHVTAENLFNLALGESLPLDGWQAAEAPSADPGGACLTLASADGGQCLRCWEEGTLLLRRDGADSWARCGGSDPAALYRTLLRIPDEALRYQARDITVDGSVTDYEEVAARYTEQLAANLRALPGELPSAPLDAQFRVSGVSQSYSGEGENFCGVCGLYLKLPDGESSDWQAGSGMERETEGRYAGYWMWGVGASFARNGDGDWYCTGMYTGGEELVYPVPLSEASVAQLADYFFHTTGFAHDYRILLELRRRDLSELNAVLAACTDTQARELCTLLGGHLAQYADCETVQYGDAAALLREPYRGYLRQGYESAPPLA